jgi:hypothetical protein
LVVALEVVPEKVAVAEQVVIYILIQHILYQEL